VLLKYLIACLKFIQGIPKDADTTRRAFAEIGAGRSPMFRLLRNPFYCGRINVSAYKDEPAIVVEGRHEPLVSRHLFLEVQDALDRRKRRVVPKNMANTITAIVPVAATSVLMQMWPTASL
jgi:Recombinase